MGEDQLKRLGTNEQPFELSKNPCGVFERMKSIQIIEDGDIYLGIEAFFEKDCTKARIGYKIYKNNDYVDVDVTLFLGDIDKIITVPEAAIGYDSGRTPEAQRFLDAIKAIRDILVNTEEWKALPDYEFIYD